MTAQNKSQDWQHVARDTAAWDLATDRHDDDGEFTDWADLQFGEQARQFIAMHDSLITFRFGPDTVPTAPAAPTRPNGSIPETADEFARAVQALLLDAELVKDLDVRDAHIAELAIDYAARFLPGGIRYPARHPDRR